MSRGGRGRRAKSWVPQQHGAWAMLVVPYVAGLILAARAGGVPAYAWPLGAFWMLGYFAFNAASLWLKAAPARRPEFVPPLATYAGAATALGLVTLWLAGPPVLGWVPVYACLLVPALVLAARRHERAVAGGLLTTAAASLVELVVLSASPAGLAAAASDPGVRAGLVSAAAVFGYFFGTVLYVKTNIRQRHNPAYYAASVGWHAALAVVAGVAAVLGWAPAWWAPFFAATTVRAALVPRRRPPLTPKQIGLGEIAFCVWIVVATALQ